MVKWATLEEPFHQLLGPASHRQLLSIYWGCDGMTLCALHPLLIPKMLPTPSFVLVSRLWRTGSRSLLRTYHPFFFESPSPRVYAGRGGIRDLWWEISPDLERLRFGGQHICEKCKYSLSVGSPPRAGVSRAAQMPGPWPGQLVSVPKQGSKAKSTDIRGMGDLQDGHVGGKEDLPGIRGGGGRSLIVSKMKVPAGPGS